MRVKELVAFIKEREAIRGKKEAGRDRPWTKDPILAKYRFCNVHREHDRVSKWLREEFYVWFTSPQSGPMDNIWFTAVVARLFNQPDSLTAIRQHLLPFKSEKVREILKARAEAGLKNFNAAYIVSTNGISMDKVDYVIDRILSVLWADRAKLRPTPEDTLFVYHNVLMSYDGLGSFIAAQIVADLKYMEPLKNAADWWTFAASGPGSRRGLNRVYDRPVDASWKEVQWHAHLMRLREAVNPKLHDPLHAQDLQNCLCEFDKYERARLGEGTPKQIYKEAS